MSDLLIYIAVAICYIIVVFVFFQKKIKCPKCGKLIKTQDSRLIGLSLLVLAVIDLVFSVIRTGNQGYPYSAIGTGALALFFLCGDKKVFCINCLENVPLEDASNAPPNENKDD
jgi:hypothetical protein